MKTELKLKGFRIRGAIQFNPDKTPPMVRRVVEFLDLQNDSDLWPSRDLSVELGRGIGTLLCHSTHPALKDYRHEMAYNRVLWGSKPAIKKLRKQFHENHG